MMLVLVFDTSTLLCASGWADTDDDSEAAPVQRFAESVRLARPGHAETLLPTLTHLLEQGGAAFRDVGLIVFGKGPGTFTGLRIGMSTAKGLALAHQIPAVGISSLEALALSSRVSGQVATLIDAKRGELYYALYEVDSDRTEPRASLLVDEQVATVDTVVSDLSGRVGEVPIYLAGNGIEPYQTQLSEGLGEGARALSPMYWAPSPYWMARIGYRRFAEHGSDDMDAAEPVYLRKPDAKLPVTKQKKSMS